MERYDPIEEPGDGAGSGATSASGGTSTSGGSGSTGSGGGSGSGGTSTPIPAPTPIDPTSLAALGAEVVNPPFLAFIDIVGDPVRATTWEAPITPSNTGDPDLDGQTFTTVSPAFVDIGPVTRATGGSDQVTLTLSGIVGPDSALLDLLGDPTKWKGRVVRLWFMLMAPDRVTPVGVVFNYYTGRMMSMSIKGSAKAQSVEVIVESYLASLTSASNRSYLDQADFDPNDNSAALTVAIANGATTAASMAALRVGSAASGDALLISGSKYY